jgi:glycosyltransferase involved in cell wall biosynthesis
MNCQKIRNLLIYLSFTFLFFNVINVNCNFLQLKQNSNETCLVCKHGYYGSYCIENCIKLCLNKISSLENNELNSFEHIKDSNVGPVPSKSHSIIVTKPILCFYIGYTPEFADGGTHYGSEYALKRLAEELTNWYQVYVIGWYWSNHVVNYNVNYVGKWVLEHLLDTNQVDIMIVSRYIHYFLEFNHTRAKKTYIWVHDTYFISWYFGNAIANGAKYVMDFVIDKIDGVVVLTEWHKKYLSEIYQLDNKKDKFFIIGNAIDTSNYEKKVDKVKNRFIYTSSVKRSLLELVTHFIEVRKVLKDAELFIYRGAEDLNQERFDDLRKLIDSLPYVHFMGKLEPKELAVKQLEADYWYYPTNFLETYCISGLEALMAGCISIASDHGALTNVIGDRGILLKNKIHSQEYFDEALEYFKKIDQDEELKESLRIKGKIWASKQDWKNRVYEWLDLFGYKYN